MRITYDATVDAAYIYLVDQIRPGGVSKMVPVDPVEIGGMINLDFDSENHLLGIEVLGASTYLSAELLDMAARD